MLEALTTGDPTLGQIACRLLALAFLALGILLIRSALHEQAGKR